MKGNKVPCLKGTKIYEKTKECGDSVSNRAGVAVMRSSRDGDLNPSSAGVTDLRDGVVVVATGLRNGEARTAAGLRAGVTPTLSRSAIATSRSSMFGSGAPYSLESSSCW